MKITNQKAAGQYQCSADNGIDEKQSKIIQVNVAGRNSVLFYEFCAFKYQIHLQTKCGAEISVLIAKNCQNIETSPL